MTEQQPEKPSIWSLLNQVFARDYFLSLPERTLRSLAALIGGSSLLLTETLLPQSLRGTTTYRVFIGNLQSFLITQIAQLEQPAGQSLGDDYVRRKMAGNVLEAAGLLTIHFSPLWIFAIAGDAAAGSKLFLRRLVHHLAENEIIPPSSNPGNLDELLGAVQAASRSSATAIDTPPLSRAELARIAGELSSSYAQIFSRSQALLPRFQSLQERMERVARRENISLEMLSGLMAANVAALGKKGSGSLQALGKTSSDLLGEQILDSYAQTLDEIGRTGVSRYTTQALQPFLQAAAGHFDPGKRTWTERYLGNQKQDA